MYCLEISIRDHSVYSPAKCMAVSCRHQKIAKNCRKYPAASCYGSSAKYTAYAAASGNMG